MKISILTEGGRGIGFGHMTRCLAIARAIREFSPGSRLDFVVNGDKAAEKFLRGQRVRPIIVNWIKEKKKIFQMLNRSDVVILDSYLAARSYYADLNKPYTVAIDDYRRLDYDVDMVINPSVYGLKFKNDFSAPRLLLGKEYIILRREFRRVLPKTIRPDIKNVLITFGGRDLSDFIREVADFLSKRYPDFKYETIDDKARLNAVEMRNLMLRCDISISGGGQTLYELARCGVPTIGIRFAENQTLNLEGMEKTGFLNYAGYYRDRKVIGNICKYIRILSAQKNRAAVSNMGRSIVDAMGAKRIAEAIFKCMPPKIIVRKATPRDCYDIWRWRNDLRVRRISFNRERISYEDHKEWFKKKVRDNQTWLYIGQNDKKEKVGQVRFDADEGRPIAYININLNPTFFGRGLGNRLIKLATEAFLRKNPHREIVAEILDENLISKKTFFKAGYRFSHYGKKSGRDISIFKFGRRKS